MSAYNYASTSIYTFSYLSSIANTTPSSYRAIQGTRQYCKPLMYIRIMVGTGSILWNTVTELFCSISICSVKYWLPLQNVHLKLSKMVIPSTVDNLYLLFDHQALFWWAHYNYYPCRRCHSDKFSVQIHPCAIDKYCFWVVSAKIWG